MSSQIRSLEGKITATFIEIGRLVYEKYEGRQEVSEESLQEKTKEILGLEHEITLLKAELDARRAEHDPNRPASQRADVKAGWSPTPGFLCPNCQAPANKEKSFCPLCGGSLQEAKGESVSVPPGDS